LADALERQGDSKGAERHRDEARRLEAVRASKGN
jgi:hypothetical protein